jgi:predicted nucleic acid-binding protein
VINLYIDTSAFLAVAFNQSDSKGRMLKLLRKADLVVSSDLLISEAACAFLREKQSFNILNDLLAGVTIVSPNIEVSVVKQVLKYGYIRGADAHHLSCALTLAQSNSKQLKFLSLDIKQNKVAQYTGLDVIVVS